MVVGNHPSLRGLPALRNHPPYAHERCRPPRIDSSASCSIAWGTECHTEAMDRRTFLAGASAAPLMFAAPQSADEAGFTSLFDGRSLDGWSVQDGPEAA